MLKRTPSPSNSAAIRDFFGLPMLKFTVDRVSLNSKVGWKGDKARPDQGIKLGYLWNCSFPHNHGFFQKMAGYLKGNDPIGETLFLTEP